MDFKTVLNLIIDAFQKEKVNYALIGGFAMGALGISRATADLDFLVDKNDLPKVEKIMQANGYECIFKSENVSQYASAVKIFGEVDFIHAFRKISVGMLERARDIDVLDGKLKIKVLNPEDIIGLKVQAMANDDSRKNQELADIEILLSCYKNNLNWSLLEEYFSIFDQQVQFRDFKIKYGDTK